MVVELAAGDQFRYDVEVDLVLQELENSHHVRVVRPLENLELLLHQVDKDLVLAYVRLAHDFDGAGDSCLRVETLAHFSERSLAQNAPNLVFG